MPLVSLPAAPASRRKFVVNPAYRAGSSVLLQPLVGVDAGQRDLRGAGQVQVVLFQVVEVGLLGGQEPGAVHGPLADQDRRQHGQEPLAGQLVAARTGTAPSRSGRRRRSGRRTGSRTAAPPGPCRSSRAREPSSVASLGGKPNCGGSPQVRTTCGVLLVHAVGRGRVGQVRDLASSSCALAARRAACSCGAASSSAGELAQLGELARAPAGRPWTTFFCSARSDSARSVSSRQLASAASSSSKSCGGAAPGQRGPVAVRILPGSLEVDHLPSLVGRPAAPPAGHGQPGTGSGSGSGAGLAGGRGARQPVPPGPAAAAGRQHRAGQDQRERGDHLGRERLAEHRDAQGDGDRRVDVGDHAGPGRARPRRSAGRRAGTPTAVQTTASAGERPRAPRPDGIAATARSARPAGRVDDRGEAPGRRRSCRGRAGRRACGWRSAGRSRSTTATSSTSPTGQRIAARARVGPTSSATPPSPTSRPAHRTGVSRSGRRSAGRAPATMIGTDAISSPVSRTGQTALGLGQQQPGQR